VQHLSHQVLIKHSAFYGLRDEWIVGMLRLNGGNSKSSR
jgi:hypothetical protein